LTAGVEIDFETRSPVDLKRRGAHPYFEHPKTEVLIGSYKIGGGPTKRWQRGEPCPADLRAAIESGATISAHNAAFEILCLRWLAENAGWPSPPLTQFRCTAATAAAMALPRSLGDLGAALGLSIQKDKEGMRLIRKFSIPRKPHKDEPPGLYWNEPEDHPADFELFKVYCDHDVDTEAAADERLVPLSTEEQELWWIDQEINQRGIRIDRASAMSALRLAEKAKKALDREMREVTGGAVPACSQPGKLVEWVQSQGVEMTSAAKAEITDLLELDDLPPLVRRAVSIRQEAAKTSVSKLQAMLDRASSDGRIRGSFMFCGAATRRWSSVGANLANLPRPRKDYASAMEDGTLNVETLFQAFRQESPEHLQLLYGADLGRPLHLISDALRSFIWAAPGHVLLQADYSGIEGAVAAWGADEHWKVKALHEIMADPSLPDMYRRTAAQIMNTTTDVVTKKHPLRQSVGKTSELALGFGGGVQAFVGMARNYQLKLDPLYEPVWGAASEERREKATKRYESVLKRAKEGTKVMSREAWLACEIIKVGWREANSSIQKAWHILEDAARDAIRNPGTKVSVMNGRATYLVKNGFMWLRLASGGCLAYASPKLRDQVWAKVKLPDETWSDPEVMDREEAERAEAKFQVLIQGNTSPSISALGVNSTTKKWERSHLYGGLLFENWVQATARDLLVNGMRLARAEGYPLIYHNYDELVAEVPRGTADLAAFETLICRLPEWAKTGPLPMPLQAGGFIAKRYFKG
jgi:DNA polymerase